MSAVEPVGRPSVGGRNANPPDPVRAPAREAGEPASQLDGGRAPAPATVDPERAHARTDARAADDLAGAYRVEAALPARGGQWVGRADLAEAVDALRKALAPLGRSRSADVRVAGAEIAAEAVTVLRRLAGRAERVDRRRREASRAQLAERVAERRRDLGRHA